jgi:hypothetical protein
MSNSSACEVTPESNLSPAVPNPEPGKNYYKGHVFQIADFDVCHLTSIVGYLAICIEHSKKLKAR